MSTATLSKIPAHLKGMFSGSNSFAAAGGDGGTKTLSTKGGVFNIEQGNYRNLVSETTLDVVILSTNPNKVSVNHHATQTTEVLHQNMRMHLNLRSVLSVLITNGGRV